MRATAKEHSRTGPPAHASVLVRLRAVKKRHLLLLALLPLLVVLWLPLLRGRQTVVPRPAAVDPAPVATPAAPAAESAPAPGSTNAVASTAALGARLQKLMQPFEPRWSPGKDPGPFQATITAPDPTVVAQDSRLVPSAIVLSHTEAPVAIVNGQSYRPGDSVDGHLIVAIEERRVVYRDGIRTYAVPIPQPTLGSDHD